MQKHLISATLLLLSAVVISLLVASTLPPRVSDQIEYASAMTGNPYFDRYLSKFPKKELPYAITTEELARFMVVHNSHEKWLSQFPYGKQGLFQDSLDRIENALLHFPDPYQLVDVRNGWLTDTDSTGSYWRGQIDMHQFQRYEASIIPIAAFETPKYYATLAFAGMSILDVRNARKQGYYCLSYFDKKGECLGAIDVAGLKGPFFMGVTIDPDLRFKRERVRAYFQKNTDPMVIDSFKTIARMPDVFYTYNVAFARTFEYGFDNTATVPTRD